MSEDPVTNQAHPPPTGGVGVAPPDSTTRAMPMAGVEPVPGYRLVQVLGRGGFGEVWRADGPGGIPVALKFIFLGGKAADVELRALDLMKGIRHPHLLGMSGAWQKNGFLILALELADGTLADRLDKVVNRGQPGLHRDELLRAIAEAAEGIDHLNAIGIQHRDVKPANLLLVGGGVKVADFGLAKVLEKTVASHSGSMTLAYAAPETFGGMTSPSTDQYALAVSYCELRGNRLPFMGQPVEMMAKHVADPPDLSMLPEGERPAVARALAKRASDRWPDCRSFVTALAAIPASDVPAAGEPENRQRGETHLSASTGHKISGLTPWSQMSSIPPPAPVNWRSRPAASRVGRVAGVTAVLGALEVLIAFYLGWRPFAHINEPAPVPTPPMQVAEQSPAQAPVPKAQMSGENLPTVDPEKKLALPAVPTSENRVEKPVPGEPKTKPAADGPALASQARAVLKAHCYRCHNGEGSSSGYAFDVTKHETLVNPIGADEAVVVAGNLEKSPAWDMVAHKRMPQKGSPERDSFGADQRAALRQWIEVGAPAFPAASDRPFISLKAVLTAIRDHLDHADRDKRPYLRYFSIAHIHNDPAVSDEDLRYHQAAISKVVNSLSWAPRIVVPEAVDAARTIFVVDIRGLDWDRGDLWSKVADAYPYGLKYGDHRDHDLDDLDREIARLSNCKLPWVRGDWFVATASRPPLYYDLLRLPTDAHDLERQLGVEIVDNFRKDKLARAGFAKSGVSGQNRLLERHEPPSGFYWKSYDFQPGNGRADLLRFPLGPPDLLIGGLHPYQEQAFKHDGGEIIFRLPNGLQAYYLVNGAGDRIDTGPIGVVSDDKRVSGTPEIVTGVSCMACHVHGMIPFKDHVRDHSAVFGAAEEKVKRLYLAPKEMDRLVEADRRTFMDALEKTIGPSLRAGPDKDAPLTKFKEPVAEVVIPYRRGYLDLKAVARELFVENPDDLLKTVGATRFKELGLEALTQPGGLVGRLEWEAVDGFSLMQDVAKDLGFTPFGKEPGPTH